MKSLALRSVFSDKAKSDRIRVIDQISLDEAKTKAVVGMLTRLELGGKKCVILDEGKNETLSLSCRNLQEVIYSRASLANGYDLLNADYVIMTKAGLEKVQEVFG